jgi:SH3-like domain-containing protein
VRSAILVFYSGGFLLTAAPGFAQSTIERPTTATHSAPAHSAAAVKKTTAKKTPVVKPKHGAVPRHPVHPKAPVATPKEAAKPVPKPVAKAPAKPPVPANVGSNTGLPLPRYASLKTDDINMRSGPGARYPVLWTYKRRELPVRIEREFDVWRLVEDMDGIKGWVNGATLTGRRTFVVIGTDARTLRAEASDDSEAVALLKPGVVGRIHSCDANAAWCQVQAGGYHGYLQRNALWGTDAGEAITP